MPQHVDADDLALLALGERVDGELERHVASCAECGQELAELRAVVARGRTLTAADTPHPPPARVWDRVTAELALDADAATTSVDRSPSAPAVTDLPGRPDRRAGWPWLAAAAVAGSCSALPGRRSCWPAPTTMAATAPAARWSRPRSSRHCPTTRAPEPPRSSAPAPPGCSRWTSPG